MTTSRANRGAIQEALEAVGSYPIESIEPRMADLEQRLLASIDDDDTRRNGVVLTFDQPSVRHATRRRRTMLVATAASVIAVLSLAIGWVRSGTDDVLIDAAVGVEVVLPDGTIVAGAVGLVLPPGAVVDVDGSLTIDGRSFGPGRYRIAADGSILAVVSTSTTAADAVVSVTTTIGGGGVNDGAPRRPTVTITGTSVVPSDDPTRTRPPRTSDRVVDDPVRPSTTERARPSTSSPTRPTTSSPDVTTADRPAD